MASAGPQLLIPIMSNAASLMRRRGEQASLRAQQQQVETDRLRSNLETAQQRSERERERGRSLASINNRGRNGRGSASLAASENTAANRDFESLRISDLMADNTANFRRNELRRKRRNTLIDTVEDTGTLFGSVYNASQAGGENG